MNVGNPMEKKLARIQARLKWEAACERMAFALAPPAGVSIEGAPDLGSALQLAQAALEEVRAAFQEEQAEPGQDG